MKRDSMGRFELSDLAIQVQNKLKAGEKDDDVATWLMMDKDCGLYNSVRLIQQAKRRIKTQS